MSETMPRIYTDPSQSEETRAIVADLDVLDTKLEAIPDEIETEKDAEIVGEYRAQFNKRVKDLEKERKEMTAPLLEVKRSLDGKYNAIKERCQRAIQLCDNMLRPYLAEQRRIREEAEVEERRRKEAEAQADREAEEALKEAQRIAEESTEKAELKDAESKVAEARTAVNEVRSRPAKPKPAKSVTGSFGSKVGISKVWKWRIVDISKVPEEFMLPPEECVKRGELTKIAKKDQDRAFVPGVEFYFEDSIRSATR